MTYFSFLPNFCAWKPVQCWTEVPRTDIPLLFLFFFFFLILDGSTHSLIIMLFSIVFHNCSICSPMDFSPPGSSVHRILQAKILEWVAMPSCRGSSWPRDWTWSLMSPALAGGIFTTSATWVAPYLGRLWTFPLVPTALNSSIMKRCWN